MQRYDQDSITHVSESLLATLRQTKHLVVFTGAGVLAESGVSTVRDALTGLWEDFNVEMLTTLLAVCREPVQVWGWHTPLGRYN